MSRIGNFRGRRLPRRLVQLYAGLALYGASMALMIESTLGLNPWDVFHQGLAIHTGLSIGTASILVGAVVLLLWIPLRQRPGLGTVSNVVVVGLAVDATLALLPTPRAMAVRILFMVVGIVANGMATGLYIGARFGPGPRDGLMTGWVARRPGRSIRMVRTVIEVTVVTVGWLLGGTVWIGTLLYAVSIGPLAHRFIPLFTVPGPGRPSPAPDRPDATGPAGSSPAPVQVGPAVPGVASDDGRKTGG
ncbi:hypothetical protein [Polymorphospora sp. NPDC050346]|uniref:membrane protein YczE n=1 Tax=Polymorphospora sp. NPDC050346 TaxID=3155780 RepID=UPI0034084F84